MTDRGEFIIRAENLYGVTEEIVFLNVQPAPREVRTKINHAIINYDFIIDKNYHHR